ncbi:MAG: response regulator [Phototrophicaceae bacterium]
MEKEKPLQGKTVVVVDDEPDSQFVAQKLLEMAGAIVVVADNGKEGLEKIRQHRPSFVVSDLSMPVMTGWQMVDEMKKDRTLQDIPVIALTAHAMSDDRPKAIAAGFHNYLTKPLMPENFINSLLRLVMDTPEFKHLIGR